VHFLVRYRTVFDALWHNQKFAWPDYGFVIAKFNSKGAFDDQEQFIFIVMVMEDELAPELHGFDVSVVQIADDAGMEVVGKVAEFFAQIYRFHRGLSLRRDPYLAKGSGLLR
jgi:hypothetical protein